MVREQYRHGQRIQRRPYSMRLWGVLLSGAILLGSLTLAPPARAAGGQSDQALRDWLEQHRAVSPQFTPGQTLTGKDRALLEPFIPQAAWEYYFFDGMEMEIAPTGHYPPPPEWGKNVQSGYSLDQDGVLVGFTGGGFPFPEINPMTRRLRSR